MHKCWKCHQKAHIIENKKYWCADCKLAHLQIERNEDGRIQRKKSKIKYPNERGC